MDWLKSTKNLKLSQMHCKSLQFLGERSPWDFKKSLKTPRVCRARANFWKADSTYWYVLSVALKCWGNSSKLSLNSSKSLSAIFVWPQRRFFTCPNGFSRTTTLRGEGSIGNQKSARQRFLLQKQEKARQNRRSNLTRALQGGVASEVLLYRHLNKKKFYVKVFIIWMVPSEMRLESGF